MVAAHIVGLFAPVMLVCAIQGFVWAWRDLPDVIVHPRGVTIFLSGFQAIHLAVAEIASLLIYHHASYGVALAIEPFDRRKFRRRLIFIDRYYFDQSRRFVGHGLSLSLHLDTDDLSHFHTHIREQYGDRAKSQLHPEV
jgi:hypothetical protein